MTLSPDDRRKLVLPKGYINWEGGSCPVGPYDVVQVLFRSGRLSEPGFTAHNYSWRHADEGEDAAADVVAYTFEKAV